MSAGIIFFRFFSWLGYGILCSAEKMCLICFSKWFHLFRDNGVTNEGWMKNMGVMSMRLVCHISLSPDPPRPHALVEIISILTYN